MSKEKTNIVTPYGSANLTGGQIGMILALPVVLGLGIYFGVYRPILQKMNVLKTKDDKETEKLVDDVKSQPFWTPNYYKQQGGHTISMMDATNYARTLDKAMHGWFNGNVFGYGTDEDAIYGVFNALGTKGNISMVVEAYMSMYNVDLYADLASELSDTDMLEVAQKISLYGS